jgi:hypothetical protein
MTVTTKQDANDGPSNVRPPKSTTYTILATMVTADVPMMNAETSYGRMARYSQGIYPRAVSRYRFLVFSVPRCRRTTNCAQIV